MKIKYLGVNILKLSGNKSVQKKHNISLWMISFLICSGIFSPRQITGKSLGNFHGYFDISRNPIVVSKENLKKAAAHSNSKTVRICALIDTKTFSEAQLNSYGWQVIYRIGDIVTLQGSEQSAPYLGAVDGMRMVRPHWNIPIKSLCMDSARAETNVDIVHRGAGNLPRSYTGKKVLLGLIDTEFDVHHPAFKDAQGKTRFIALWDQVDSTDTSHIGFTYGTMKSGLELESDTVFGLGSNGHGTLMMSYAAGSDTTTPYYGVATDAQIIGVKYSDEIESDVINGLKWIFDKADSLKVPCVVNMSIGIASGPHDGTSLTDRVIDSVSAKAGHIVVGAIGNDGDKNSHISFALTGSDTMGTWVEPAVDSLYNPPRAQAVSYADIWGDSGVTLSAILYVMDKRDSSYKKSRELTTKNAQSFKGVGALWNDSIDNKVDTLAFYSLMEPKSALNGKTHLEVAFVSTNPNLLLGIALTTQNKKASAVNAWNIEKLAFSSGDINGFYNGDSASTLDEIGGTAKSIISVGSYCSKWEVTWWNGVKYNRGITIDTIHGKRNGFSGIGPTIDGRIKPDICAPGDMVVGAMSRASGVTQNVAIWPDTTSTYGRYTRGTGTSVSAPIVAGIIALMLQADSTLTCSEVRKILQSTAIKDQYTGTIDSANNLWGAGKVNAYGALARMLDIETAVKTKETSRNSAVRLNITPRGNRRILVLNFGNANPQNVSLLIYTVSGRQIFSAKPSNSRVALPGDMSKGVYFVNIMENNKPVLKQKIALW
jgi:hypothetical protein